MIKSNFANSAGGTIGAAGLSDLMRELDQFPQKIERNILKRALKDAANVLVHAARADAPVKTGVLRRSIRSTTVRKGRIGPVLLVVIGGQRVLTNRKTKIKRTEDAYYAPWVEFGTEPHDITAASGKALSFGGVLTKKVTHPGAKASGFFGRAIDRTAVHATDTFVNRVSALLTQARSASNL